MGDRTASLPARSKRQRWLLPAQSSGVKPGRRKPRHVQIRARMTELGITRLRARSRTRTSRTRTGGCKRSFHSKGGTYGGGVMLLSADRPRMDLTPTRRRLTSHVRRNQTLRLDDGCGRRASRQQGRGKWIQQVPPHDRGRAVPAFALYHLQRTLLSLLQASPRPKRFKIHGHLPQRQNKETWPSRLVRTELRLPVQRLSLAV